MAVLKLILSQALGRPTALQPCVVGSQLKFIAQIVDQRSQKGPEHAEANIKLN